MKIKTTALLLAGTVFLTACSFIDDGFMTEESYVPPRPVAESVDEDTSERSPAAYTVTEEAASIPAVHNFNETQTVSSSEEFFAILTEARDNLIPSFELKINKYSAEAYNIQDFEKGKYSLASEGKQWGSTAYMTYTFDYSDSYMITRAIELPQLEERLSEQQLGTIAKLKEIQSQLITEDMDIYRKELAIHDYITKNYSYDTKAASMTLIPDSAASVTDFLSSGIGVCEAYAYTFKALCNLSGIECYVITGKMNGIGHAWNLIKLDGEMYHVDVTSDDPIPDIPGHSFYTYFNVTDEEASRTHVLENKWYECTDTKYNYFVYNGLLVYNRDSFIAHVENKISQGAETILFKAQNYYVTEDDIKDALRNKGFTSYTIMGDMEDPNGDFELALNK